MAVLPRSVVGDSLRGMSVNELRAADCGQYVRMVSVVGSSEVEVSL